MISVTPKKQSDGTVLSANPPRTGDERVFASHNLADKCTWFGESARVTEEVLVDSGDGLTFQSEHEYWIDMVSGRVHRDDYWSAKQGEHGYLVTVTVGDEEMEMREPFADSGGDYYVKWETGEVVFFESQSGNTVKASYSYATGSTFTLKPDAGKKLIIESAEADFSTDIELNTAIVYAVWAYVDAVAPELVDNPYPSGTLLPVQTDSFKRVYSIIQEAKGAYPLIAPVGSTAEQRALDLQVFRRTCRGMRSEYMAIPFAYQTARELRSDWGVELRISTKDDVEIGGEMSSLTFYCTEWDL